MSNHGRPWATPETCVVVRADALEALAWVADASVDVVFADPPYFLSTPGGTSCRAGRRVGVDKGAWDRARPLGEVHAWNLRWLAACRRILRPTGTLWVCGTTHNIHSVGFALDELGFRTLNAVTWEKPNPPPNLGRRCLTHSTETLLWASTGPAAPHYFNYPEARRRGGGRQLKTVWRFTAPPPAEKESGRHPTQKPEALVEQALAVSTPPGGLVCDPFLGSGTTLVVAKRLGLRGVGFERDPEYARLAVLRVERA